jgi:MFS family permease
MPWLALTAISIVYFGNFYVYDAVGPVADLLQQQRHFSSSQIGMLNAIYSLPNVVLVLVGGVLADRFGATWTMVWSTAVCLAGSVLTAFGGDFMLMATGRLLFGIGAETQTIALTIATVEWFAGRQLAFAMGIALAIGRSGSYVADMSPTWFAGAYAAGWQPPLMISAVIAAVSMLAALAYLWLSGRRRRTGATRARDDADGPRGFRWRDVLAFGPAYWYLLVLCVLWFAVILAFRSTFAILYFQHAHGLDLATAGAMNSYVFFASIFATPAFGWLCDRSGRYVPWLVGGSLLLPVALLLLVRASTDLWPGTALIGISYSLVPAVMWPLVSRLVPADRFGTALGFMFVVQNAGIAGANLVAGALNDRAGASAHNPAGYLPMMHFFIGASALGFLFSLLLWRTAGRRRHEATGVAQTAPA